MAFSSGEYEMALPVEWTDKVCFYLEAEDLLNLSAANTFWRNAVNRNCIWKPLCVKYFDVSPSEKPIIDRKCRVEPAFVIVANSSPNLSDICSWRIRYAQEIHVINNWIQQRYHADEPSVDFPSVDDGFILGNSLLFTYNEGRTLKYGIRNLNNDIITHYNQIDQLYSLRNGFLTCYKNIISYYAIKEDYFELKIRTVFEKALHPEIPLLADDSTLQKFETIIHKFYDTTQNKRYFIPYCDRISGTIVVWDFENLNTFSFNLSFFHSSLNEGYGLDVGERESSILFLKCWDLTSNRFTLFILNIQNSAIVFLCKYHFENFFEGEIFGDSFALISTNQIQFFGSNGIIRNVDISDVATLINCRSFYCGLRCAGDSISYETWLYSCAYEVFLIDKESFSFQVIHRYRGKGCVNFSNFFKYCSLDLVLIEDGTYNIPILVNLKKLNFIELDKDKYTREYKNNKIILSCDGRRCKMCNHNHKVLHLW